MIIKLMEEYAKEHYVPIIREDNIKYLENLIKEKELFNILELGAAIGYSSIRMALVDKRVHVVTIERDEKMYSEAIKNIASMNLNQIFVLFPH